MADEHEMSANNVVAFTPRGPDLSWEERVFIMIARDHLEGIEPDICTGVRIDRRVCRCDDVDDWYQVRVVYQRPPTTLPFVKLITTHWEHADAVQAAEVLGSHLGVPVDDATLTGPQGGQAA